ncbi:MAG: protein kinase [Kofleriaceae bacterium]
MWQPAHDASLPKIRRLRSSVPPGARPRHALTLLNHPRRRFLDTDPRVRLTTDAVPDHARLAVTVGGTSDGNGRHRERTTDGRYTVVRELARGGMGRIWIASDARLSRDVAIKELVDPRGPHAARFERELSLTSRLQHPSIVSIHDAGTWPDGTSFYVMKLVSGESLARVIAGTASLAERIALLPHGLAMVDALAYAHAQGIVHRDLKPENVLIGDFGETVVIDWGLAKELNAETPEPTGAMRVDVVGIGATLGGEVLGTPAYMPPEQAMGDAVDERADVYALGAVLYHLLSGRHPHQGTSVDEVLANVISAPPPPLATMAPGVPADLVAIIEKAMAWQPEDRYATAGELALDLKRFQRGQLVGAHRYSPRQLLWRWIRKHRAAVAVASVAIMLLAVIGVVSVRRIIGEQARAEHQRQVAEDNRAEAQDIMGYMLVTLRDKLRLLGRLDLLDEVANKATSYYDRRSAEVTGGERHNFALARANLADVLLAQGHTDQALREFRAALAIFETLAREQPTSTVPLRSIATARERIGKVMFAQGDAAAALVEYRAALTAATMAAALDPTNVNRPRSIAHMHAQIGGVVLAQGDPAAALAEFRSVLAIEQMLAAKDPMNADRQRDLSITHADLGDALRAGGDLAGAVAEYRIGLDITQRLVASDPTNADWQRGVTVAHANVGDALVAQGDMARALAEYRSALAITTSLAANDPTSANRQQDVALSHDKIASVVLAQGDAAEALAEYRAALGIREALVAKDPTNADRRAELAFSHAKLGDVLIKQGQGDPALVEYRAALPVFKALAAKDPTNGDRQQQLADVHDKIGDLLLGKRDAENALTEYRAMLAIVEPLAAKDPTHADRQQTLAIARANFGDVLLFQDNAAGALEEYRAAHRIFETLATKDPTNVHQQEALASSYTAVGDALFANREHAAADAEYAAADAIYGRLAAKDPTNIETQLAIAELRAKLGDALAARGNKIGARATYNEGLAIARRVQATDPNRAAAGELIAHIMPKLTAHRRPLKKRR